jgi:hypothetical protein
VANEEACSFHELFDCLTDFFQQLELIALDRVDHVAEIRAEIQAEIQAEIRAAQGRGDEGPDIEACGAPGLAAGDAARANRFRR